jgi:hypothetical protein
VSSLHSGRMVVQQFIFGLGILLVTLPGVTTNRRDVPMGHILTVCEEQEGLNCNAGRTLALGSANSF